MRNTIYKTGFLIALLLACAAAIPGVAAQDAKNAPVMTLTNVDINGTNYSGSIPAEAGNFLVTPTQVEIFRAELNDTTAAGPRDMAYGPRVIGFSIDPRLLAVVFGIALIGLVLWFVCFRNKKDTAEKKKE